MSNVVFISRWSFIQVVFRVGLTVVPVRVPHIPGCHRYQIFVPNCSTLLEKCSHPNQVLKITQGSHSSQQNEGHGNQRVKGNGPPPPPCEIIGLKCHLKFALRKRITLFTGSGQIFKEIDHIKKYMTINKAICCTLSTCGIL